MGMKLLVVLALAAFVAAEPEAEATAAADPYYYGGYGLGYGGYGVRTYGYGLGGYYGGYRGYYGKREAEAEPEAAAAADPYYYGGYGLRSYGYSGLGYGYGRLGGYYGGYRGYYGKREAGKINVDRGPHACSQVGGAGVDVTVLGVQHEVLSRLCFDTVPNGLDTTGKTVKDGPDVSSHLHGYDTELILLIHPGEEGLVLIVEDSTTLGPITLHASDLKVGIAGDEKEVVVNQLLPHLLIHASEREVGAGKVALQVGKGLLHHPC